MTIVAQPSLRRRTNSHLYAWMACGAIVAVFVGFAPTFYLRGYFVLRPDQPPLSPLLIVHGLVGTSWMALFLAQSLLVLRRRTDLHQRLGIVTAIVAMFLVVVAVTTLIDALRRDVGPFGLDPRIWFLSVPLMGTIIFGVLVAVALVRRRRPETHRR